MGNVIIGGGGTNSLVGGKVSLAGTAKARGLQTVDPRLVQIIQRAAERSPYDVQIFSGQRPGPKGGSRHNSGNALDIALIDPNTGEVIPNYKSSTGFPIYAEFAKVAREEQMAIAPDMADQFRWGGGFSDKDFDLMHFDFKPGGSMAYWTWQDGGKLTEAGAKAVPQFGPGYVYANGERYKAPPGQYASLWGRDPLQAQPQDAQSAIASLMAPSGGPSVPEPPTAAMGFAPTLPQMASFDGPPQAPAPPPGPPMPQPPPQWASNAGFPLAPIDEALTGRSAQDVLTGGPRPRPAGFWDKGPGGAPDALSVPTPRLDPTTPATGGPNDRRPQPPMPNMRPEGRFVAGAGGAPDAGSVPNPNPRGTPYAPSFPSLYGEQPAPLMGGMSAAMGNAPPRTGDLSAAMGDPRPPNMTPATQPISTDPTFNLPYIQKARNEQMAAEQDARMAQFAKDMQADRTIAAADYYQPQNIMQPAPLRSGMSAEMGGPPAPPPPPDFTAASDPAPALTLNDPYANQRRPSSFETAQQNFQMPEGWTPGGSAPPTPAMFDPPYNQAKEWFKGYTPGYTDAAFPAAPLPQPPAPAVASPAAPQGTRATWGNGLPIPSFMSEDQFNVSFSPGGPGMIADLTPPSVPAPSTAAQGNPFDALMGPGAAMGAMPFNDVSQGVGAPSFGNADPASWWNSAPTTGNLGLDVPTGGTATTRSPESWAAGMDTYVQNRFSPSAFAGGSVVNTPQPGQPGVVQGTMPTPAGAMDIRPPAQGGPPLPPQATPQAAPASAPRQTNPATERQRSGIVGRVLGGLLGGPIGALGGGLLGGGGGGFGFGTASFNPMGGGSSAPYGNGGTTTYQKGTSNALGGSNALSWKSSNGGTVTATQDPWTGTYYTSYGP